MKILVACEESQAVTIELRKLGHKAYSCDIEPCSGGHPEWHIQEDVLRLLNGWVTFTTSDGKYHSDVIYCKWDIIIAHPPCTYLSNVATRSFSLRCTPAEKVVDRWKNRARAAVFFMHFALADCAKIAIENPVGFMNTAYRKPDQIVHPYQFAKSELDKDNYVTKATCLWLKGLEPLECNSLPKPDNAALYGRLPSGKARTWGDTYSRDGGIRSKTFPGIARAMAERWAGQAKEEI
ncbi:MAG: DNA cytosine methyltransferase [Clostridiaceae bacterium]|nr:DNA cytosine methyltransferase [Clostridiaceae bacterium]